MSRLKELDQKYIAHTYGRFPLEIVRGEGSVVYDENGKRYIDMGSGIGVTSFGIADRVWQEAVIKQIGTVQHMSNLYYTEPCVELAEMLCEKTGMSRVFFSNSGAEANECAIKAARKYAAEKKGPEYHTILTLTGSFHGRTITTLSATGQEHYHEQFRPLTPGFAHCDAGNMDQIVRMAKDEKAAGVMIECVQGEGGVVTLPKEYVCKLAEFANKEDLVLIVDEVQTGNGRTGKLYSYMHYGIRPDIVSTAKGLGGGLPIGATMFGEKTADVYTPGDHGSTFGGNPVSCAGAVSILKRLDDAFLNEVAEKGEYIRNILKGAPGVKSVSGLGLMVGIETEGAAGDIVKKCMEKGVLCLTAKSKVRLLPALNIPMDVLKEAMEIIKEVCAETAAEQI